MRKYQVIFILALLFALGLLLVETIGYPYRPKILPVIVISLAIILLLVELIKGSVAKGKKSFDDRRPEGKTDVQGEKEKGLKFLAILAWIAGMALTIWFLGLVIALPLFNFIYIKTHGERWFWAMILSFIMLAIVYVGFGLLLHMPLYKGFLFE